MSSKLSSREWYMLSALCVGFFVLYATQGVLRHVQFHTAAFDLGIFDQAVWQYAHFSVPYSSLKQMVLLGDHLSPILALLAPAYWVWSDPRMLIVIQAAVVVLSVYPLYLVFRDVHSSSLRVTGPLFVLIYLSYVGLHNGLAFDVHPSVMLVLPLSILLYAYHCKRWRVYWAAFMVALLFKEDVAPLLCMLGLYQLLVTRERRLGMLTALLSATYFVLGVFVLMPLFGGEVAGGYIDFARFGETPVTIAFGMLTQPHLVLHELLSSAIKRETLLVTLGSFGFLPLLSGLSWFLAAPLFVARFLSVTELRWGLPFHYSASIAPIYALGMTYGLQRAVRRVPVAGRTLVTGGMLTVVLACTVWITQQYGTLFLPREASPDAALNARAAVQSVPGGVSVSAQSPFVPHLSQREHVYLYPDQSAEAAFIIVSRELTPYPLHWAELDGRINQLVSSTAYELVFHQGETYVFRRR